jgi:hypothetical protein
MNSSDTPASETPSSNEAAAKALFDQGFALIFKEQLYEEGFALYDECVRRFGDDASPEVRKIVVSVLQYKSQALLEHGKAEEAFATDCEIAHRFGGGLLQLQYSFRELLEQSMVEEAFAIYDEVAQRFASNSLLDVCATDIMAFIHTVDICQMSHNRTEEAIAVYDWIDRCFSAYDSPGVREQIVKALDEECKCLKHLGMTEEAKAVSERMKSLTK